MGSGGTGSMRNLCVGRCQGGGITSYGDVDGAFGAPGVLRGTLLLFLSRRLTPCRYPNLPCPPPPPQAC